MNWKQYIQETKEQFYGYTFHNYFNLGLIFLAGFLLGIILK